MIKKSKDKNKHPVYKSLKRLFSRKAELDKDIQNESTQPLENHQKFKLLGLNEEENRRLNEILDAQSDEEKI